MIGLPAKPAIAAGDGSVDAAARYLALAVAAPRCRTCPTPSLPPPVAPSGVLTPFVNHTVPAGQGLIGMSLFLHVGGGSLFAYTAAALTVLVVLLAVYAATYPLLRGWTFVVPSLVLFFAARSFGSYLVMLAPVGLLAAARQLSVADPAPAAVAADGLPSPTDDPLTGPWRSWLLVVAGGMAATIAVVGYALARSTPLQVAITNIRTTGQLATVEWIEVSVRNQGAANGDAIVHGRDGWRDLRLLAHPRNGRRPCSPGRRRTTPCSPNQSSQPAQVSGAASPWPRSTSGPDAVSTSDVFLPSTWHVAIVPVAVSTRSLWGRPSRCMRRSSTASIGG